MGLFIWKMSVSPIYSQLARFQIFGTQIHTHAYLYQEQSIAPTQWHALAII